MGDLPRHGGGAAVLRPLSSSAGPYRPEVRRDNWAAGDRACREIIRKVQPTSVSEEKRKAVIQYIQRLIKSCLGAEVFPYGSVPLKTYLPDGDIDLTVFGGTYFEDTLADDMKTVLEEEERNAAAEFVVKDVQLIRAEVQIVKCIVQDIVVDISFNQLGGLCTLCFLEQVDRTIGKNHLFKNSIILIKAWCYYESRILGAHHGLISTYALETLVLYIFHLYHSKLDGPLAVLYKFLDYFSKFCWDSLGISLDGPIQLSTLPVVTELPEDCDKNLLLNKEFLNYCVGMFSVPFRDTGTVHGFQRKYFNVLDPLKEFNNLGRSVSKGNFYRIRSAFSYGAKKLAQILLQPQHSIANELRKFFANTMERHGGGPRPDVHDIYHTLVYNRPFQDNFDEQAVGESDYLSTSCLDALRISSDSSKSQTPTPVFAPHLYFSKSKRHDWSIRNGSLDSDKLDKSEKNASENQLADRDEAVALSRTRDVLRDTPETLNSMDLTGDFDIYLQYLHYGRTCYEYMHSSPNPVLVNPSYHSNGLWENLLPQLHYNYKQNGFSHQHQNGFHPNTAVYPMPQVLLPSYPYWEEVPKPRGTGTYFPTMNVPFRGYRPQTMKGRNQVQIRAPRNNGRNVIFKEQNDSVMVASSDSYVPFSPQQNGYHSTNGNGYHSINGNGYHSTNGLFVPPEGVVEFEETSRPVSSPPRTFSGTQTSTKVKNRILLPSTYHLKDEVDFPPLSV